MNPNTPVAQNGSGPTLSREDAISQATEFIIQNQTWMLTTCGSDHVIRSRPMLNVNETFNGDLYVFSNSDDIVLRRITENPQVNIAISEPANNRFASITGSATKVDDPKKTELLWNQACSDWFESESPTSAVSLIKVDVVDLEYWDSTQSLLTKIGKLFRSTGSGLAEAEVEHEKIDFPA